VYEVRHEDQLNEIMRKTDFGSRIRNACVLGDFYDGAGLKSEDEQTLKIPEPEDCIKSLAKMVDGILPPQLLVLTLECGDTVFLFIRRDLLGNLEFVTSRFQSPRSRTVYPGYHMAVDPSSRYMALACAEGLLMVYELESKESLQAQYANQGRLKPVAGYRPRAIQGVIHKMEFLYPTPNDDSHIILLLIVVRNGKSRMVTYEWQLGDNLNKVLAGEKQGYGLPPEHQMPLLLIPLTVGTSFLVVCHDLIGVCKDALQGTPKFERVNHTVPPTAKFHAGTGTPLWTAWARPIRRKDYLQANDNIYVAREDGNFIFLEIDVANTLQGSVPFEAFDCNISPAFAALANIKDDILILAGDSGHGKVLRVRLPQALPVGC
jgi:hypothetical protein